MKIVKKIFLFYIQGSIHVALATGALTWITMLEHGLPTDFNLVFFVFFGTIAGYNFVKYTGAANNHHLEHTPAIKAIKGFTLLILAPLIYTAVQLPFLLLLVSAVFGLLTILYAFPVFRNRNLRSLQGTKIFIIALVWAGATVVLPLFNQVGINESDLWLEFLQRFLFVVALTLPFEIRDLKYDEPELATLPQVLGITGAKWLGGGLLLTMVILDLLESSFSITQTFILLFIACITGGMLYTSKVSQPKFFASFWVEGIPLLWLLLFLAVRYAVKVNLL